MLLTNNDPLILMGIRRGAKSACVGKIFRGEGMLYQVGECFCTETICKILMNLSNESVLKIIKIKSTSKNPIFVNSLINLGAHIQ